MASGDLAEHAVEDYLDAVASGLVGPRALRAAILDELRDGLHEALAIRIQSGERVSAAARSVMTEFGAPAVLARGFAAELADSRARHTVAAYLCTGPLIGLLWLLWMAPPDWWRTGPVGLWGAVPAAPAIGLGCIIGFLILAATGRGSRWLRVPPRQTVHGALAVVAVAVLADLFMLASVAHSGTDVSPSMIAALAILASTSRLALSIVATAQCLRVRRIVTR